MKKIIFIIAFIAVFAGIKLIGAANSYSKENLIKLPTEADKRAAIVTQIKGVSVYIFSVPKDQYDYLGSVKKSFALTGGNEEMVNGLVNKARKEYPTCDAIVFNNGLEFEKCDVIKFK